MKIPSSSSLFFATLAISSSSSSLAAPAGDVSQADGLSSPSMQHSARRASTNVRDVGPDVHASIPHEARQLESIGALLEGLPVIGSALTPIVDALGLGTPKVGAASVDAVLGDDQLAVIQSAVSQASSAITAALGSITPTLPVSAPAGLPTSAVVGSLPAPAQGLLGRDALLSGTPAAAQNMAPQTPALPANPPNTPALPASAPKPPVKPPHLTAPKAPAGAPGAPAPPAASPGAPAAPITPPVAIPRQLPVDVTAALPVSTLHVALPIAAPAPPGAVPAAVMSNLPPLFSKLPVSPPIGTASNAAPTTTSS